MVEMLYIKLNQIDAKLNHIEEQLNSNNERLILEIMTKIEEIIDKKMSNLKL